MTDETKKPKGVADAANQAFEAQAPAKPAGRTLKVRRIGNSLGVVLPKELLARLHVEKGDTVYATESPDGVRLTPFDPAFEQQMEAARKIMKARRNVLHELAK